MLPCKWHNMNGIVCELCSELKIAEVAIPLVALSIKLTYPAANLSLLWPWKAFFSDLAALTTKSENKEGFSTSEKARITRLPGWPWSWHVQLHFSQLITAGWINVICTAVRWIALYPLDCRVNKCIFTWQPGKEGPVIRFFIWPLYQKPSQNAAPF